MDKPWGPDLDAVEPTIPSGQPVGWPREAHDGLPASPIKPGHITALWQELRNAVTAIGGTLTQTATTSLRDALVARLVQNGHFEESLSVGGFAGLPLTARTFIGYAAIPGHLIGRVVSDLLFAREGIYIGDYSGTPVQVISQDLDVTPRDIIASRKVAAATDVEAGAGAAVRLVGALGLVEANYERLTQGVDQQINTMSGGAGLGASDQVTISEHNLYASDGDLVLATIQGNVTAGEKPFIQGAYCTGAHVFVDLVNLGAAPLANSVTIAYRIEKPRA